MPLNARAQSHASTRRSPPRDQGSRWRRPSHRPGHHHAPLFIHLHSIERTKYNVQRLEAQVVRPRVESAQPWPHAVLHETEESRGAATRRGQVSYVKQSVERLADFLREEGFAGACTTQALARPTGRDFEDAATFLLRLLDDSWRRDSQKKFDDEFVDVFKKLRYPFPISRTALAAVGTAQHVAPFLSSVAVARRPHRARPAPRFEEEEGNVAVQLEHQGADRVFYEYASVRRVRVIPGGRRCSRRSLNAETRGGLPPALRRRRLVNGRRVARSRRDAALAKIASLKDAAASLSKAIDARSTAEALRDKAARDAGRGRA